MATSSTQLSTPEWAYSGPRPKNAATYALEEVVSSLLNPAIKTQLSHNLLGELELKFNGNIINVTQILENNPDFEQLQLSPEQLNQYAAQLHKDLTNTYPSAQKFNEEDPHQYHGYLHYGEKLAIRYYTQQKNYKAMQLLLRLQGRTGSHLESNQLKPVLLSICIASCGLAKPLTKKLSPYLTHLTSYRVESAATSAPYILKRKAAINKNVNEEEGFTSSSTRGYLDTIDDDWVKMNIKIKYSETNSLNPNGKPIHLLSHFPEDEILFPPHTQFRFTYHKEIKNSQEVRFNASPFRSYKGVDSCGYSPRTIYLHELHIINTTLNATYLRNKRAFFCNSTLNITKRTCLQKIMHQIADLTKLNNDDYHDALLQLKKSLQDQIYINRMICQTRIIGSLGQTDKQLNDALNRVNSLLLRLPMDPLRSPPNASLPDPEIKITEEKPIEVSEELKPFKAVNDAIERKKEANITEAETAIAQIQYAQIKTIEEKEEKEEKNPEEEIKKIKKHAEETRAQMIQTEEEMASIQKDLGRKFNFAKLIEAILTQVKEKSLKSTSSSSIENRLKSIQYIARKKYADQMFCGNDALNRAMLLDGTIANLLNPDTLQIIFQRYINNKNDPTLQIYRSHSITNIVDILQYALQDEAWLIKYLTNNEKTFSSTLYAMQKHNYDVFTQKILTNLLITAQRLGIDIQHPSYQLPTPAEETLTQQFSAIEHMIQEIKDSDLLYTKLFSTDEIRLQCIAAFREDFSQGLSSRWQRHSVSARQLVIITPSSLTEMVRNFVTSPERAIHPKISHLFYDRLHFEAAMVEKTPIQIGGSFYTLRDILREIVKQCEAEPITSTARQQIAVRLRCVRNHLKRNFLSSREEAKPLESKRTLR